ncbi:MAG: hypothetical protein R3A45_09660 [Bdellovibrionota bacterium]
MIRTIKVIVIILFGVAFIAMSKKPEPSPYKAEIKTLFDKNMPKVETCQEHVKNIVEPGFVVLDEPIEHTQDDVQPYLFEKNEEKAMFYIDALDTKKLLASEFWDQYMDIYLKACIIVSDKELLEGGPEDDDLSYPRCKYIGKLSSFSYALTYAIRDFSWSKQNKIKAKTKIISMIQDIAQYSNELLATYVGFVALQRLAEQDMIPAALGKEITLQKNHYDKRMREKTSELYSAEKPNSTEEVRAQCKLDRENIASQKMLNDEAKQMLKSLLAKLDNYK